MGNKLIKQFMSYAMGSFAVLFLGFLSSPIITRLISPSEYGKMSLFNMVVTVFGMVSILGLDQSYIRFYNRKGVDQERLFKICRRLPLLFTGVIVASYVLFAPAMNQLLFEAHSVLITLLVIICVVCTVTNRFEFLYVRMQQNGKMYSLVQICQKIAYIVAFVLFFLALGDRFEVAIAAISLSMLLSTAILFFRRLRRKSNPVSTTGNMVGVARKELILFGLPFVVNSMLSWLMISTDKISIKMWYGDAAELGFYSAAATIIVLITTLKDVFSTFYAPVALKNYEQSPEKTEFFRDFYELIISGCFLLGTLFIMSKDIIVLLLGEKYRTASYIMPCMLFVPVMHTLSEITSQGINFKNKPMLHNVIEVPVCLLNFFLNYLLIPLYGARGAAIASGFSYIVFFYGKTMISEKLYHVGYKLTSGIVQVVCVFAYALFSTLSTNALLLFLTGVLLCILLVVLNLSTYKKMFRRLKIKQRAVQIKRILSNDIWNIAVSLDPIDKVMETQELSVHWVKHKYSDRFFADPFLLRQDKKYYYIVAEEYKFWKPKGIIVLLKVSKENYTLEARKELIVEEDHLSFPFVKGETVIVPECYRSGLTRAYEIEKDQVKRVSTILPYGSIDGVFFSKGGKEYYLYSQKENALSDLYLTVKSQDSDTWTSISENPIKSDIRTSRSAGKLFYWKGKCIRPVQDSEKCYGHLVRLMEVHSLEDDRLVESEIACLKIQNQGKYQKGFHTMNVYENCIIVDGCRDKFQPIMNTFILKFKDRAVRYYKNKYAD